MTKVEVAFLEYISAVLDIQLVIAANALPSGIIRFSKPLIQYPS